MVFSVAAAAVVAASVFPRAPPGEGRGRRRASRGRSVCVERGGDLGRGGEDGLVQGEDHGGLEVRLPDSLVSTVVATVCRRFLLKAFLGLRPC